MMLLLGTHYLFFLRGEGGAAKALHQPQTHCIPFAVFPKGAKQKQNTVEKKENTAKLKAGVGWFALRSARA